MSTDSGLVANAPDVEAGIEQSRLFNADLAPVPPSRRKWGMLSFAALWISMSACIPTYMLASSLIGGGMNWWQAVLTIFLGNLIVLVPMILNAHAGTLYGIPFPVYCRASFGTDRRERAGRSPRAGGVRLVRHPDLDWRRGDLQNLRDDFRVASRAGGKLAGHHRRQFLCFLFFWGINMLVIYRGIDTIRFLLNIKAPLLIALGLLLLAWAYREGGRVRADPVAAVAIRRGPAAGRTVLGVLLPGADRHGRFLGDALAEHPRLLPLRQIAARPGHRPGARPAD